jgi:hypothetical protein
MKAPEVVYYEQQQEQGANISVISWQKQTNFQTKTWSYKIRISSWIFCEQHNVKVHSLCQYISSLHRWANILLV